MAGLTAGMEVGQIRTCPLQRKVAYLTFDDGPHEGMVEIARSLRENNFTATFFPVAKSLKEAKWAKKYSEILALGHDIGGHTYGHPDLASNKTNWTAQVDRADELWMERVGHKLQMFRAPYGSLTVNTAKRLIVNYSYMLFRWSFDSTDSLVSSKTRIFNRLNSTDIQGPNGMGGEILLFHIEKWAEPPSLVKLIQTLRRRCPGCEWVGLSACLEHGFLPHGLLHLLRRPTPRDAMVLMNKTAQAMIASALPQGNPRRHAAPMDAIVPVELAFQATSNSSSSNRRQNAPSSILLAMFVVFVLVCLRHMRKSHKTVQLRFPMFGFLLFLCFLSWYLNAFVFA